MYALLLFDSRPLFEYGNPAEQPQETALAIRLFLEYCLNQYRSGNVFDTTGLRSWATAEAAVYGEVTYVNTIHNDGTVVREEPHMEQILETLDVLERHFYHEVVGALNELTNHYGVVRLHLQHLTPFTLAVAAHCVHLLSPRRRRFNHGDVLCAVT